MPISAKVEQDMTQASWIRKMFEQGVRLKQQYGADQVFDFSLGNPIFEPPAAVQSSLQRLVGAGPAGLHRYMPNAGHPAVREAIAAHWRGLAGAEFADQDVIMTTGAAGALNVALKSLLDPGDQVVIIAPYFSEYRFYVDNHGGELVVAESSPEFDLDLDELERKLGPRTKAVLINTPNNPTGRMYSAERLAELGRLLADKERAHGRPITLLSDEPYRKIVYDGLSVPSVFAAHPNTVLVLSHSKDLGLAGERIGYALISPQHADREALRGAMTFVNRTLGFVNAPSLFQQVAADCQDASVPVEQYQQLRDLFCAGLERAGLEFVKPQGAFYLFPKTPTADDMAFVQQLLAHRVLAVPGAGFGRPGHIRLSYCVTRREIETALPLIAEAAQAARRQA
jgi:aspartate aminotransferase